MTQAPVRPPAGSGSLPQRSAGLRSAGLRSAGLRSAGLRSAGQRRAGSAEVTPRPHPARLGAVHVLQLVAVEAVVLGVLAAARGGVPAIVAAATTGLLVVAFVLTRRQGRWLVEWVSLGARARRRRRLVPDRSEADPRLAALRCLAPHLAVHEVDLTDGTRVGVGYDGEGWFATAAVAAPADLNGDVSAAVPLGPLTAVLDRPPPAGLDDPGQFGAAVQVVTLTVPTPDAALDDASPPARSYRELLAATGTVAADRITWVSVRLEARVLATVGAGDLDDAVRVPPALPRMVRRMVNSLRNAGLPVQVLDADALLDALARCCDLAPAADGMPVVPEETQRVWRSAALEHATYWLQEWPEPSAQSTLLDTLAATPGGPTSVAVRIVADPQQPPGTGAGSGAGAAGSQRPGSSTDDRFGDRFGDRFDVRVLIRVAAPVDRLEPADEALTAAAAAAGARLFRLDGEQAPAVYATAPTGGGPR